MASLHCVGGHKVLVGVIRFHIEILGEGSIPGVHKSVGERDAFM